jgi:hypothetical protein
MRAASRPPSIEVPLLGLTDSVAILYALAEGTDKEGIMTCTRCQGCMTRDHFIDLLESAESMWMDGWRCLNCGNVRDSVMEQNRRGLRTSPVVSTARVPGLAA